MVDGLTAFILCLVCLVLGFAMGHAFCIVEFSFNLEGKEYGAEENGKSEERGSSPKS